MPDNELTPDEQLDAELTAAIAYMRSTKQGGTAGLLARAVEALRTLQIESLAAAKREQWMREALTGTMKYIRDSEWIKHDGSFEHECEFHTNPLNGACDVCDMWAAARAALTPAQAEAGNDK